MGIVIMSKKFVIPFVFIIAIIAIYIGVNINKNFAIVSCNETNKECIYKEQNFFGNVQEESSFNLNDIMQCNIETLYKTDSEKDTIDTYEFNLYFNANHEDIKFKTKQRENLDKICVKIFEKKAFEYKFPLSSK